MLSAKEVEKARRVQGELRNKLTSDKSQIRLSVAASSLSSFSLVEGKPSGLISFEKWCKLTGAPKYWSKYMGLSAIYDLDELTDEQLGRLLRRKDTSKEHTWYLHFGPIPADLILDVDFKIGDGYVTYNFEEHGLEAMSESGIECVRGLAHEQLLNIIKPAHQHEVVHAAVICVDPSAERNVLIRGDGNSCVLSIDTRRVLALHKIDPSYPIKEVESWALENIQELTRCWECALEGFYRFYPEKRKVEV
ncbi:hypothetical protein IR012_12525 [Pseudomonas putida]|uniref:hypothetical protein n=1 Tax=Pseudomonas putida TaxID=303 RepID=UPI0018A96A12|nr:hypothetical protein [Pseudomonas putida]MBF8670257.1 hypothetical protein [Pseudomonas putida]MBF8713131.1 hypothetical protein [Pseudomonas putida]